MKSWSILPSFEWICYIGSDIAQFWWARRWNEARMDAQVALAKFCKLPLSWQGSCAHDIACSVAVF